MFFNPAINAARAVAYQINSAVTTFANNFFSAVKPQITKQYAAEEKTGMMKLVFQSSRFCYYILLFLALPILLEVPMLLDFWLKEVPEYTVLFARLVIINALIDSMGHPLMTAIQATGHIRPYQIVTAGILLLNLPVSYLFLNLGYPPQITMIVSICISVVAQLSRIIFAKKQVNMSISCYCGEVLRPIGIVTLGSFVVPLILSLIIGKGIVAFFVVCIVALLSVGLFTLALGITKSERFYILGYVKSKIYRG